MIMAALAVILLVAVAAMVIAAFTLANVMSSGKGGPGESAALDQSATDGLLPADLDWWRSTPIYQVYPRSFQDSDGDGTGDLRGIKSRVPYLHSLGIKAIWLSPIYESPMKDFGYDISNFTNIAPVFGTMEDFHELVEELHKHGRLREYEELPYLRLHAHR